ncbi:MAG TPA: primosomal protein N' [Solirubrobacteraceae bacterium]|jgi:primosomal protein N' (replication factor Y)
MSAGRNFRPPIVRVEPLTRTRAVRGPFDYRLAAGQDAVEVGSVLRLPFGGRVMTGVVVELAEHSAVDGDRLVEPQAVLPDNLGPDLVSLALWMAQEYCSTPSRALSLMLPPGLPRTTRTRAVTSPVARSALPAPSTPPPPLTDEQRAALDEVLGALDAGGGRLLLHGVTGSGKTEVYLRAVESVLRAGRSAIVLVPEIGLTPLLLGRFQARFGDQVAILHSALTGAERRHEWRRLRSGQARVAIGPRSAVFAPLADLGLVIVDEEHDGSYKHEGDPRYDARTVAERRATQHGAVLLCGSATPRPESVATLTRLRLAKRVDGRPLPPVEVLDMRGLHHPLHPRTRLALADVHRAGGKAIVLLNRRGWSNFLTCRSCGRVWNCPNCEVALVLHRAPAPHRNFVACHHCGHREPVPERCGSCGSAALARHGAGTQRLEQELTDALGGEHDFPIWRLDADVVAVRERAATTLSEFGRARAGLLVGTQVVAKGHDFPDVTLAVVMDADQTLRFPDFRAEERTFALVTQLAGRAGRGDAGGTVLVQTLAPEARAIQFAARHDSDGFLAGELERRRALRYPPFGSLIRIVCAALQASDALAISTELSKSIEVPGASVLGPAPLFRLRGKARSQVVIKSADRRGAVSAVGRAVDAVARDAARRRVSVSVDVDPQ